MLEKAKVVRRKNKRNSVIFRAAVLIGEIIFYGYKLRTDAGITRYTSRVIEFVY